MVFNVKELGGHYFDAADNAIMPCEGLGSGPRCSHRTNKVSSQEESPSSMRAGLLDEMKREP